MAAEYNSTSPWFKTPIENDKLGIFRIRPVAAQPDDFPYTIEPQYTYRPDLLSYDLYQTTRLWWVFTQRNMDILQDPIWDFKAGTTIYLPKKSALFQILGL